jgi:hypothetical protein
MPLQAHPIPQQQPVFPGFGRSVEIDPDPESSLFGSQPEPGSLCKVCQDFCQFQG